jgi:MFS family permease
VERTPEDAGDEARLNRMANAAGADAKPIGVKTPGQKRIGPIILAAGIEPRQVYILLLVTCACTFVNEFAMTMQPLIFARQLHIDPGHQGVLAGMLGTTQQFGTLIFIGFAGALADIIGRRVMLVMTLVGFFLCLLAYPLIAAVWALYMLRFVWGVSFTGFTAGAATLTMDCPDNRSRGKFITLVLVIPSLISSLLVKLGGDLPSWLRAAGFGPHGVLLGTFWIISIIAVAGAGAAWFWLARDGRGAPQRIRPAAAETQGGVLSNIAGVFSHARANPRFALILLIGSVVRTDSVILGAFVALWIVSAGRLQGIDAITATKTVGLMGGIRLFTMVAGLMVFGPIADRVNRVVLVLIALTMTAAGFAAFGLISDVFGWGMIAVVTLIGIAEGAQSTASQSLIAQEAPPHLRGSSMGVFAFLGTASLMVVNFVGGHLFDTAGYASPMIMESVLHLAVLIAALILLKVQKPAGLVSRQRVVG